MKTEKKIEREIHTGREIKRSHAIKEREREREGYKHREREIDR